MIYKKFLPYALLIGVPYETFWSLNPRKLKPFEEAYKLREQKKDEEMWRMGMYVCNAVAVAVEHNLAGNKAQSEYYKKPLLVMQKEENDENIKRLKVQQVFTQLEIMRINDELNRGKV